MKRILIVDDNQMLANLYRGSLTAAGEMILEAVPSALAAPQ
jgi:CheY-like chemotaxis protein